MEHSLPHGVSLFGLARSVYTRIARLALEEKGVAYQLIDVEIFGQEGVPPGHLERHPFGRIPALQHGPVCLYETAAIARYVDEAFPGPALQATDPVARARMNQVIGVLDAYAYMPMVWGVFVQRVRIPLQGGQPDEREIESSLPTVRTCLHALASLLGSSPYFGGPSPSLADLHAYPMLRYLWLAKEGRDELQKCPTLVRWLESFRRRPSAVVTASQYEAPG